MMNHPQISRVEKEDAIENVFKNKSCLPSSKASSNKASP